MTLKARTITGNADGPHLVVTGGVHGDEFEPMAAIRRLIEIWPAAKARGRVTLVPVVNEAAFRRGSRTADDGLDLARCCPGDPNGSVTERTARALSELIRLADFYIDLHTAGTMLQLSPLVGYILHADESILNQQRAMARAFNLPIVWGTSARLDGRSLSVARDAHVPAIYAEYGGSAVCRVDGVNAYVDGCLNVAAHLDMLDRELPPSVVRYTVEDDRDESGYLQVQHPAPCDGYFEAAVELNQTVERGQTLGHVVDALGERREPVAAHDAGIVLMLRTFPSVTAGDALVALLPISEPGAVRYERGTR